MTLRPGDPRSGMVLVIVLWTIALVSALAMAASTTFRGFAGIVALDRDRARADALLHAGLETSGGLLAKFDDKHPLSERETSFFLSTGSVKIRLSDEMGRININKAPPNVLAALLYSVGAGDNANLIAKAIDTWRQRDQADQSAGAPAAAPPASKPAGPEEAVAKDDSFQSFTDIRQLAQIPGMEPDYLDAISPLITVFGDSKLNAMTASADVIAALPGITPAQVAGFISARYSSPSGGELFKQMLGPAKDYVTTSAWPVARVEIIARLIDGYSAAATAVIVILPHDKKPYRILSWTPLTPAAHRVARLAERF